MLGKIFKGLGAILVAPGFKYNLTDIAASLEYGNSRNAVFYLKRKK